MIKQILSHYLVTIKLPYSHFDIYLELRRIGPQENYNYNYTSVRPNHRHRQSSTFTRFLASNVLMGMFCWYDEAEHEAAEAFLLIVVFWVVG